MGLLGGSNGRTELICHFRRGMLLSSCIDAWCEDCQSVKRLGKRPFD